MKLLFVCTGNICRSPLAEALFNKQVQELGLAGRFYAESAGTSSYHIGEAPHHGIFELSQKLAIPLGTKRARQVTLEDFEKFDLLIAMDHSHEEHLKLLNAHKQEKIRLFLDFAATPDRDVHDPYFDGNFEKTYQQVLAGCQGLLNYLTHKKS